MCGWTGERLISGNGEDGISLLNYSSLVEFPEVDEDALLKLRNLISLHCKCLGTLPLSLEVLTSFRNMIVLNCGKTMEKSYRINCEESQEEQGK